MKFSYLLSDGRLALGVLFGTLVCLFSLLFLDFFQIIPSSDPGLLGAILGALIAGAIGVAGQALVIITNSEIQKKSEEASINSDLLSLFQSTIDIGNNLHTIKKYLDSSLEDSRSQGVPWPIAMLPASNVGIKVEYSKSEKTVLLRIEEYEIYNRIMVLDGRNNTTVDAIDRFGTERKYLMQCIKLQQDRGKVKAIALPGKEEEAAGRMRGLQAKLGEIDGHVRNDLAELNAALDQIKAVLALRFNAPFDFVRPEQR